VLERTTARVNPWEAIEDHSAGSKVLRSAEESLTGQSALPD
jgi:hypothetical protein